jgi:formylglycine-generating enzyme required for sulfatase activity
MSARRLSHVLLLSVLSGSLNGCGRPRAEPALRENTTPVSLSSADAGGVDAASTSASAATMEPPGPMIVLKGGRFRMGSDYFNRPGERPAHFVTLPSFRLDATQVTVAAYRACVNARGCKPPVELKGLPNVWTAQDVDREPMTGVTWNDANDYCVWAGRELPTEEQWEYACTGAIGRTYPWGFDFPDFPDSAMDRVAGNCHNHRPHAWAESCPVGLNPRGATPEGIQDLQGKTAEWTASTFCPYDRRDCTSSERADRGGSRGIQAEYTRCAERRGQVPTYRHYTLGFRCAQSADGLKGATSP